MRHDQLAADPLSNDGRARPGEERWRGATVLSLLLWLVACAVGPPAPAGLDPANDACARCRMAVSDRRFAAQIVAPGEEPLFFDDIGCLRDHLADARARLPDAATVYVADHRATDWVDARNAVFTRSPGLATPMASGLMAHASASSRDLDSEARGGAAVPAAEILGPRLARGGGR